jgi:ADP-heptose:LPS heptosyltransferase
MPVLIIKHGALGDFFQSLPLYKAIRQHHRGDSLTLLTTPPYKTFAEELGFFDSILTDPRRGVPWPFFKEARQAAYTHAYDLQLSERTGWYLRCLRYLLPRKTRFYGKAQAPPLTIHSFVRRKDLLLNAGVSAEYINDFFVLERVDPPFPEIGATPYALMVIGTSASHRIWPIDKFINVGQWCAAQGITPVLIGSRAENALARIFLKEMPAAIDLTGKTTPMDILQLGAKATLAIGNDTGPMHGIAMVGCPSVVLFSDQAHSPAISMPVGQVRSLQGKLSDISAQEAIALLGCLIVHSS